MIFQASGLRFFTSQIWTTKGTEKINKIIFDRPNFHHLKIKALLTLMLVSMLSLIWLPSQKKKPSIHQQCIYNIIDIFCFPDNKEGLIIQWVTKTSSPILSCFSSLNMTLLGWGIFIFAQVSLHFTIKGRFIYQTSALTDYGHSSCLRLKFIFGKMTYSSPKSQLSDVNKTYIDISC